MLAGKAYVIVGQLIEAPYFSVEAVDIVQKKRKVDGQLTLPASSFSLLNHNNQRLFSDYFLNTVMARETWRNAEEWQALRIEAAPIMATLRARYEQFAISASSANEAQTESDWIRPVLEALGQTFEVQAKLRMPGPTSAQHPDYVFYISEEQRQANRGRELDDRASQNGALAVGDAKQWDIPLDQMRKGA
ncbi:MAG: hypothetical protein ACREBW_00390, partial [Candidatus Micrarchaeaceae archaeon]